MEGWRTIFFRSLAVLGVVGMLVGPLNISEAQTTLLGNCVASVSNVWNGYSFTKQTGVIVFTAYATPTAAITDAMIGLSPVAPSSYADLAAAVRFSSASQAIDIRNGSVYSAAQTIHYVAGSTYRLRIVIDIPNHRYSVYVTPPGGTELVLATNYAFRTEQSAATSLSYWAPFSDLQTIQVCNVGLSTDGDTQPPSVPQSVTATAIGSTGATVSWNASTDNVGVTGYDVYQDNSLVVSTGNLSTSYTITGLVPPATHSYTVAAYDAKGNTSAPSAPATVSLVGSSTSNSYDQTILADHPVVFWDLNPQSSTESDLAGNGHTGTYKGGTPVRVLMPNGDTAADFNGSSQYLTIPSSQSFSIPTSGSFTWEAWIKPDVLQFPIGSSDGYVDFMGKCTNYSPSCEWEARMYDATTAQTGRSDRLSAYVFNPTAGLGSGADWQPTSGTISAGQWIHVVGEYTTNNQPSNCSNSQTYPGSINIWVDGVEWSQSSHAPTGCMSQFSVAPKTGTSPVNIGTMALDYWFKGAVGKVAFYNYLLSQSQIATHYQKMTGQIPVGSCGATCNL